MNVPKRKELPPRVKVLLNTLKPGMTNQEVQNLGKKHAPYQSNKSFLKAYQNRYVSQKNDNVPQEKLKPYKVYTTVLNMPAELDSES